MNTEKALGVAKGTESDARQARLWTQKVRKAEMAAKYVVEDDCISTDVKVGIEAGLPTKATVNVTCHDEEIAHNALGRLASIGNLSMDLFEYDAEMGRLTVIYRRNK